MFVVGKDVTLGDLGGGGLLSFQPIKISSSCRAKIGASCRVGSSYKMGNSYHFEMARLFMQGKSAITLLTRSIQ